MAVVQEQKQSSSYLPPKIKRGRLPKNTEKLFMKKSSCLKLITANNVVNANAINSESHKRKRATVGDLYETLAARISALERAKEVQANLAAEFPSTHKVMLPSHVSGGFWLGLPRKFCCDHLPKQDTMFVLEDKGGEEYPTKYLWEKVGLSGGWRGFSIAHKLVEGDVVVFHLVTPSKFKVYIVKANGSDDLDCALGLIQLDACINQSNTSDITAYEREENKNLEPIPEDSQENIQKNNTIACNTKTGPISDHSENESEGLGSDVMDGIRLSESVVTFEEVKCMENFNVFVNGLIINSEFTKHLLTKYHELCCSQKSFLHDHLLEGLNCKLAAGVISETINIADAIRSCKITTSEGYFSTWDKTLKAFEELGMNVGFLRTRLDQLVSLASKSKRCKEARIERDQAEEGMRALEAKLLEVKETINRLDSEIETINVSSEKIELMFREVANAPW